MYFHGFQILHMHIASVEKLPLTTTGAPLQIRCKTFLSVTFVIPKERDCHEVFVTLQQLAQPGVTTLAFLNLYKFSISFHITTFNVCEEFCLMGNNTM
jgi:myotubularin-related protein 6/7/8